MMKYEWKDIINDAVNAVAIARKIILIVEKMPTQVVDDYIAEEMKRQIENVSNEDLAEYFIRALELEAGVEEGGKNDK